MILVDKSRFDGLTVTGSFSATSYLLPLPTAALDPCLLPLPIAYTKEPPHHSG